MSNKVEATFHTGDAAGEASTQQLRDQLRERARQRRAADEQLRLNGPDVAPSQHDAVTRVTAYLDRVAERNAEADERGYGWTYGDVIAGFDDDELRRSDLRVLLQLVTTGRAS